MASYTAALKAFRPLSKMMKLGGTYPRQKGRGNCCSCESSVWFSKTFNILLLMLTIGVSFVVSKITISTSSDYTTAMSFWAILICAAINIFVSLSNGKLNSDIQQLWIAIDQRLGIEVDEKLTQWGKKMLSTYILLNLLFFGTSTVIVFDQRYVVKDSFYFILVAEVILVVWHNAAIILPQICYYFLCRAIRSRFDILGVVMKKVLLNHLSMISETIYSVDNDEKSTATELEGFRKTYHLLTNLTQSYSRLFSPMIILSFLLDSGIICTCMYRLINTWDFERWTVPLEILTICTAILKILATTMLGSSITDSARSTLQVLPKTSYKNRTGKSKYQAQLFSLTSADDEPIISASGFFKIDRRLFTATMGTVATYFVVLLQFRK